MHPRQQMSQWKSWRDPSLKVDLTRANVMDYFSNKANPFYDHTCNNAFIQMQRKSMEFLKDMIGIEYILLHSFEPSLFVIRKQHRISPTEVCPLANFYIVDGTVYQTPDVVSVIGARLRSISNKLNGLFEQISQDFPAFSPDLQESNLSDTISVNYNSDSSDIPNPKEESNESATLKDDKEDSPDLLFLDTEIKRPFVTSESVDMLIFKVIRDYPSAQNPLVQNDEMQGERVDEEMIHDVDEVKTEAAADVKPTPTEILEIQF